MLTFSATASVPNIFHNPNTEILIMVTVFCVGSRFRQGKTSQEFFVLQKVAKFQSKRDGEYRDQGG